MHILGFSGWNLNYVFIKKYLFEFDGSCSHRNMKKRHVGDFGILQNPDHIGIFLEPLNYVFIKKFLKETFQFDQKNIMLTH